VIAEKREDHKLILEVEGAPDSYYQADLVRKRLFVPKISSQMKEGIGRRDCAAISMSSAGRQDAAVPILLTVHFPPGEGWKTVTVTLTW
jgi:hypothetical protein